MLLTRPTAVAALVLLWLLPAAAPAQAAPDFVRAKQFILDGVVRTSAILKAFDQPRDVVSERLRTEFRQGFDINAISNFVLGPYQAQLTAEQKGVYKREFEEFVVQTYTNRIFHFGPRVKGDITDIIRITGQTPVGSDQIMLHSEINRDGAKWVKIDWRLHERNGRLAILDIVIVGISQLQIYRSEMMAVVQQNGRGVDGLIDALRAKNAVLRNDK